MTFRTDVHIHWDKSPRIVHLLAPATTISVQDLVDTLRQLEAELGALDDDSIIDAFGKQELGSGRVVAITAVLNNAKLFFSDRDDQIITSTATTTNTKILTDTTADFAALGVVIGDVLVNLTTQRSATIIEVISSTSVAVHGITGGFTSGDAYRIWRTYACEVSGGNLLAVDANGDPMPAVLPSAFTQVTQSNSTDGALLEGAAAEAWNEANGTWPAGSMGEKLNKMLTLAKYLGLK